MEFNSLIQSRRMLKKMPPNFENFATTRRVLEHLTEANAAACVAGVYSLFFTIYGFLALDCLTLFGGSLAFKAYASVFAITSAQRTGTRKSVGESLSLASARSGQSLQKTIVEKSSLEEDV
ncbi:hypothetical protein NEOLI_004143 [Neolecta irregularis DAH-3]|uniref:Uncharacterized protein n=1 Tax=Neolecta irregularis (strain DAH-3) TaxID=1198029 RepID=A0A1U7LJG5_NEOID|nr:hypothetical protein NEOLI_004143 [Neolecta irregularis DAH-3]|eukprot:OLL22800.1 hypothetical protein NEOLI_004143 [Neolecta irregularis DAH-3]